MISASFLHRAVIRSLAVVGLAVLVQTGTAQDAVTLDFPLQETDGVLPVGLAAWPQITAAALPALEIPLLPLSDEGTLLVTVFFQDAEDRVIQARWKAADPSRDVILSNNLSEGVQGWNQRTFRVPFEQLSEPGALVFETEADAVPVKRVTLAWAWRSEVFMGTSAQNVEVVSDARRVLTRQDLADVVPGQVPDTWAKGIWKAFLQEDREPLDEPLEFSFPMSNLPQAVVLRLKVLGFPLNTQPTIWVNGQQVEGVSVTVPDLASGGYFRGADGVLNYAGWREAAVFVPAAYFKSGDNSIVLGGQPGAYLKDTYLELNFDTEGAPFAVTSSPAADADQGWPTLTSRTTESFFQPAGTAPASESGPTVIEVPVADPNL